VNDTIFKMTPEQYISERVDQYQSWYDKKSVSMKSLYLRMRALSVVGGGLVPVLINVPSQLSIVGVPVTKVLVTIISLLVVIFVSLESLFHYREQWKNYRSTEQLLGHEKFLFRSRVGCYHGISDEDAFRLLVERIEEFIAKENAATLNVMTMASESTDATKQRKGEQL
jgi:hypothetical protein